MTYIWPFHFPLSLPYPSSRHAWAPVTLWTCGASTTLPLVNGRDKHSLNAVDNFTVLLNIRKPVYQTGSILTQTQFKKAGLQVSKQVVNLIIRTNFQWVVIKGVLQRDEQSLSFGDYGNNWRIAQISNLS